MYRLRRAAAAFATVAAAAAGLLAVEPPPVQAAGSAYVALGDSYSSGTGTRSYIADGTSCQRSVHAFPSLVATSAGHSLTFRACSGATVRDVTDLQLGALGPDTAYVSISVGGNDAGFADVLTECAKPAWASNCHRAIDRARMIVTGELPRSLATLYSTIRSQAPQAQVVVAGYPRIFNGEDCDWFTWFSPSEQTRLNAMADLLNSKSATAANGAGLDFADPTPAFVGHAVCDDPEWVNGLSFPVPESYHPNRVGHASGYAPLVGSRLTGSTVAVDALSSTEAQAATARLRTQQRPYAALDRGIEPEVFTAPDLDSPQIKRAAARAGVDLSSRASIDAADRRYAALQAATRRP